ncbi:hypothetical protein MHYP_G00021160 [Metynnis hypsauchen]
MSRSAIRASEPASCDEWCGRQRSDWADNTAVSVTAPVFSCPADGRVNGQKDVTLEAAELLSGAITGLEGQGRCRKKCHTIQCQGQDLMRL